MLAGNRTTASQWPSYQGMLNTRAVVYTTAELQLVSPDALGAAPLEAANAKGEVAEEIWDELGLGEDTDQDGKVKPRTNAGSERGMRMMVFTHASREDKRLAALDPDISKMPKGFFTKTKLTNPDPNAATAATMLQAVGGKPTLVTLPPKPAPRRRTQAAAQLEPVVVSSAASSVARTARSYLGDAAWRSNARKAFTGADLSAAPDETMLARADALAVKMRDRLKIHLQLWVDADGNAVRSGKAAGAGGFLARDDQHLKCATNVTPDSARNYRTFPSKHSGRQGDTKFEDLHRVVALGFDPADGEATGLLCGDAAESIFSWGGHLRLVSLEG